MNLDDYRIANVAEVPSPALLVYPERVDENLRRLIALAGGVERLRPHVKTHKMPEIVKRQRALGIEKFKVATIAEAEMVAGCGAKDVLLAFPTVGPNIHRLIALVKHFPDTTFRAIADDPDAVDALSAMAAKYLKAPLDVLIDIDCGMGRTGIAPGPDAEALYGRIAAAPGLTAGGIHAYDGHLGIADPAERARAVDTAFAPVLALREKLSAPRLIASGTPTLAIHAARGDCEIGPGTFVFWDHGSSVRLADLGFVPAALVLTRVVSKPGKGRLCLDLGHKAIAAENPHPRVFLPAIPDAVGTIHSEEHLVVETSRADDIPVGTPLYGMPLHICPTVALYADAVVVTGGHAEGRWPVVARARKLTV